MTRRIKDLITGTEHTYFVGREQESAWMRAGLLDTNADWKLLHFYGVSGIGKTSLLRAFMRQHPSSAIVYLDGYTTLHLPEDFGRTLDAALRTQGYVDEAEGFDPDPAAWARRLNALSVQKQGIVLLLDVFERWAGVEDWLRDDWLPLLAPEVRICTAGRYPLQGRWLRGGWTALVRNIKLNPLKRSEMDEYTGQFGISDLTVRDEIERSTGGFPIVLSMMCEIIEHQGVAAALDRTERDHSMESLLQIWIQDLRHREFVQYFEVAGILLRFNQERLQHILGESVPNEKFLRFVTLPFINKIVGGWRLHESVQEWAQDLFRRRKPDTFQSYRTKALAMIDREQMAHPLQKNRLMMDKLYLHENELLRSYVFAGDSKGVEIRLADRSDLPKLETLTAQYFHVMTGGVADGIRLEPYIRPLWEADSTAFVTLWKEGELVAYYSFVPFTEETRSVLERMPMVRPYLDMVEQVEEKTCFALPLFAVALSMAVEIGGIMSRVMLHHMGKARLTIDITFLREWVPILQAAGFERLDQAAYTSPDGTRFECLQLDLRHHDLPAHIDRLFRREQEEEQAAKEQAAALIKKALMRFHNLAFEQPLLKSLLPLVVRSGHAPSSPEQAAGMVQSRLRQSLDTMSAGLEEDQLLAGIIRLAYIAKTGSHESIAKQLHLSNATYYRHLKKAVSRLTVYFLKDDGG